MNDKQQQADARLNKHMKQGSFSKKITEILDRGAKKPSDKEYLEAIKRRDDKLQKGIGG